MLHAIKYIVKPLFTEITTYQIIAETWKLRKIYKIHKTDHKYIFCELKCMHSCKAYIEIPLYAVLFFRLALETATYWEVIRCNELWLSEQSNLTSGMAKIYYEKPWLKENAQNDGKCVCLRAFMHKIL